MKILTPLLIACLFLGCRPEWPVDTIRPEGTYTGTFQRGSGRPFPVELTFSDGRYTGRVLDTLSNGIGSGYSPRLCTGTFSVGPGTINFANECFFTAEFDWSLILSQAWRAELVADRLSLSRNNDRYSLKK